jgi:hypothetical protein
MFKKLFFLLYTLIIIACSGNKTNNQENECNQIDIACTKQFVIISLAVIDTNNNPVSLDNFKVHIKDTGEDISNKENIFENYYPIIDDSYQNELANKKQTLIFTGFINKKKVISETYEVSADCCHIYLVAGKAKVILE